MSRRHNPWDAWEPVRRNHGRGGPGPWGPWAGQWGQWSGGGGQMGPPPWLLEMFGQQPRGRGRGGRRGGPQVRRGDVRTAILAVLGDAGEPINGYQVIQTIAERSNDRWKPSPGSVYPTIAQLQDEGLVEDAPTGRKALQLTDEGRTWVTDHESEIAALWAPFEESEERRRDDEPDDLKQVIGQTVGAIWQIVANGTPEQRQRAIAILADARRRLYGLLADPEQDAEVEAESAPDSGAGTDSGADTGADAEDPGTATEREEE